MKVNHGLVAAGLLVAGLAGPATAQQRHRPDATKQPAALRVEETLDVGEVMAGQDMIATFIFHNDGPRDIKILKAAPS